MGERRFNPNIAKVAREKIGQAIAIRRKELGYSQLKLSKEANISEVRVIDVEQGRTDYRIDTLLAIMGVLRMHVDLYGSDPNTPAGFEEQNLN